MRTAAPDTKARIQQSALRLFVEKGVAATTTRDLAQATGVAEGTLYRHYESKDELVRELFREHYAAFARRIETVQAAETGLAAKLRAIVHDACALFDREPTLYRFLLLIQHEALPGLPENGAGPFAVLHAMFARAGETGEARLADPDLASALFLGMLLQPALSIVHGGLAGPMSRHAEEIALACLGALHANSDKGGDRK